MMTAPSMAAGREEIIEETVSAMSMRRRLSVADLGSKRIEQVDDDVDGQNEHRYQGI